MIEPGSATFSMLVEDVVGRDADYWRLRVLPDTKMVYLEMTQAEFDARFKTVTDSELQATFKAKVIALIRKMYDEHKIALAGWGKLSYRRSFADQHSVLARGTSEAGPGESNHQFGRASTSVTSACGTSSRTARSPRSSTRTSSTRTCIAGRSRRCTRREMTCGRGRPRARGPCSASA